MCYSNTHSDSKTMAAKHCAHTQCQQRASEYAQTHGFAVWHTHENHFTAL